MTVRVRVTAIATVAVAIVLVGASALLVVRQRSALVEQLDDSLSRQTEQIVGVLERGGDPGTIADLDDGVVLVVDAAGRVIASSGDDDALSDLPDDRSGDGDTREVMLDGDSYRLVSESFEQPDGNEGSVFVAGERDDIDESIADLLSSLAWIIPTALLLLFAVLWVAVGRTLRSVERIRREVSAIGVGELDRRVPQPAGRDEIARLAGTMNEMLARIERSVHVQQQFVADASHELRTPLTRMRTELEVDDLHPEHADPAATRHSQLDEIDGMQRMIEDLLALARGDANSGPTHNEAVDLDDVVLAEIRSDTRSHSAGAVTVDASRVSAVQVVGRPDELRRVVRNILDNARRHARSAVAVELAEVGGLARLRIDDDGPGVPPDRRSDVFERFTRLDDARTGGSGHAGLGLAIVHDVVRRHAGRVAVEESPLGGARFVVELPISPSSRRA